MSWTEVWQNYLSDKSTVHGLRYVFLVHAILARRLLWIVVFLGCTSGFLLNAYQRIAYYASNPVSVNIEVNNHASMDLPAVTICNHNRFRLTMAVKLGYYNEIRSLFSGNGTPSPSETSTWKLRNASSELQIQLAHKRPALFYNCTFAGQPCEDERDFAEARTDFGVCYTLNGDRNRPKIVRYSGSTYGLDVVANVQQYEYMEGPENTAGIRVLIHSPTEIPRIGDLGFNVPVGMQALIGLQKKKVVNIPRVGNLCGDQELRFFDPRKISYSDLVCRVECEANAIRSYCLCHPPYVGQRNMSTGNSSEAMRVCNLFEMNTCVKDALAQFRTNSTRDCSCQPSCTTISFIPTISYASISQINADKLLLRNQTKVNLFRNQLRDARGNASRYDPRIRAEDDARFQKFTNLKREMIDHDFYPKDEVLAKLADVLKPPCFLKIDRAYDDYANVCLTALDEMEKLSDLFTDYDHGMLITSYIQFLWQDEIQLDNIWSNYIEPWFKGNGSMSGEYAAFVIRELRKALAVLDDLKADVVDVAKNGKISIQEHSYLLEDDTFRAYTNEYEAFTNKTHACIVDLRSMIAAVVENGATALVANSSADAYKRHERTWQRIKGQNLLCQHYILDNGKFDRSSFEHFYKTMIDKQREHVRKTFSDYSALLEFQQNYNFESESGRLAEETVSELIAAYQANLTSKWAFAENLTSLEFQNHVALLQQFFERVRTFIRRSEDAMNRYLDLYRGLSSTTPRILQAYFKQTKLLANKTLERLFDSQKYNNATWIGNCIRSVESLTQYQLGLQSDFGQQTIDTIRKLVEDFRAYMASCEVGTQFVMNNFLEVAIFYREMREEIIMQQMAYVIWGLICDIGGGMGLFLGASFISLFELFDTFFMGVTSELKSSDGSKDEAQPQVDRESAASYAQNNISVTVRGPDYVNDYVGFSRL